MTTPALTYPTHPLSVLPAAHPARWVAWDVESSSEHPDDGGRVSCVSVAWIPDEILKDETLLDLAIETGVGVECYAFPFDQGTRDKVLPAWTHGARYRNKYNRGQLNFFEDADPNLPESDFKELVDWLSGNRLAAHGIKFDLTLTKAGTRQCPGRTLLESAGWCTLLGNKAVWPRFPLALKTTAKRLWSEDEDAEKKTLGPWLGPEKDRRYDLVPWFIMGPYSAKDAELCIRLFWLQRRMMEQGRADKLWFRHQMDVMRVLYRMEQRGLPYNFEKAAEGSKRIRAEVRKISKTIPFEPSINGAKTFYFGPTAKGGLAKKPYLTTKGKREPVLNEDVIRMLERDGAPYIQEYAKAHKLQYADAAWYTGWTSRMGPDGRLRGIFNQEEVRSGRFSTRRINVLAMPHDNRLFLLEELGVSTPRENVEWPDDSEGHECDLEQAELRGAAVFARCTQMIDAFVSGKNLHAETAKRLFGITDSHGEWKHYYKVAKVSNFLLIFGGGWERFQTSLREQTGIVLPDTECQGIVSEWRDLYWQIPAAVSSHMAFAKRNDYVQLIDGSLSWFQSYEDRHKAWNRRVQGSLAVLMQRWMVDTERRWPDILHLCVHDSQYLQIPRIGMKGYKPKEIAQDIANRAGEIGTRMFKVPMAATASLWNVH